MSNSRKAGFTLIELLTVIAIIAILAGMIMVVGPRMIERAKMRRMDGALHQISVALVAYSTDNKKTSYPPAYGYIRGTDPSASGGYNLLPYLYILNHLGDQGLYDEFSESGDTNRDGKLSLLEYQPQGRKTPQGTWTLDIDTERYNGQNNAAQVSQQLDAKKRPFVYVPVNRQQAQRAAKYWIANGHFLAEAWNPGEPNFPNLTFPPAKYDAYVLIGVGPGGSTCGLLGDPPFLSTIRPEDAYHLAALRAYFLATRDLNVNGNPDFDFTARTTQGEAKVGDYAVQGTNKMANNILPDGTNGYGPVIFASQ